MDANKTQLDHDQFTTPSHAQGRGKPKWSSMNLFAKQILKRILMQDTSRPYIISLTQYY